MEKLISIAGSAIYIGKDSLKSIPEILKEIGMHPKRCFILADENTAMSCLPRLNTIAPVLKSAQLIIIPSGENHKILESCENIWSKLVESKAGRDAILINIGGGMICDLGGFAASVYKRGILHINIPTSLLAMVDASAGGKTGINAFGIKNSIGTFKEAHSVIIDPGFLETLPERQMISGFAEMLKHGLVADSDHFYRLVKAGISNPELSKEIEVSVKIKMDITEEDPFEMGRRQLLNLGHTFGHAFESWSLEHDVDPLLHGEAVLAGMICCTLLSAEKGLLDSKIQKIILAGLTMNCDLHLPPASADDDLIQLMGNDKKVNAGEITFVLLKNIGEACYGQVAERHEIVSALAATREFCKAKSRLA